MNPARRLICTAFLLWMIVLTFGMGEWEQGVLLGLLCLAMWSNFGLREDLEEARKVNSPLRELQVHVRPILDQNTRMSYALQQIVNQSQRCDVCSSTILVETAKIARGAMGETR